MGLLSGSSSRKTTTNNTQIDTSDKRLVEENNGNIGGNVNVTATGDIDGLTLEQTDFGAIEGALALSDSALESVAGVTSSVVDFGNDTLQRQSASADRSLSAISGLAAEISTGGQAQISRVIQNVALAAVIMGGLVFAVKKGR